MDLLSAVAPFAERGALIFFRVAGVFAFFPIFGGNAAPNAVKVLLVLSVTLLLATVVPAPAMPVPDDLLTWGWAGGREFLVGLIMSLGMIFLFASVQLAGQFIDFQMGFGVVNVIDPSTNVQIPIMGLFHNILAILIFLVMDGHHMVLTALVESFTTVPLLEATFGPELVEPFILMGSALFLTGVKLAAPVLITLLLYTVAIGMVAKTVPTINLLIVGFPIRIGLGLFAVGAALPVFGPLFQGGVVRMIQDVRMLAHLMG